MAMPYILPDAAHFPPARRHPRAGEIHAEIEAYFTDAWPWQSSEKLSKSLLLDFASFATCTIPDAAYDRLRWASKVYTLLYLVDDLVESESGAVFTALSKVTQESLPWQNIMETIFCGIEASSNGDQYPRFVRTLGEWLINSVGGQAPPYTDLQGYLDFRRINAAGYWVISTTRYALDLRLTDEELADPELMMCEKLCVDACALENDVASYDKELASESPSPNIVAILLKHGSEGDGFVSVAAVKEYIGQEVAKIEAQLHDCLEDALNNKRQSDDYRKWLQSLPYIVSGNVWLSQQTMRYNLPGSAGAPEASRLSATDPRVDIVRRALPTCSHITPGTKADAPGFLEMSLERLD
ncbi:isoprenoid synthase domain-containing protein [Mycena albidolilacea]|uniref:Terpene synthase n=1 Tax=Mycena albidolilacea TaxID=1033008 RepID=A0AAD7EZG7_9AGAR|nr:isoprenoid synthase domain-containing protein [Mycena albidolilacea]